MPDLVGLDTEAARRRLRTAHLRPGVVRFEWSREFETGIVIGQDPPAGRWVPEKSRVDLTVSSGIVREARASMTRPQGEPGHALRTPFRGLGRGMSDPVSPKSTP